MIETLPVGSTICSPLHFSANAVSWICPCIKIYVLGTEMIPMILKPGPPRQDVRLVVLKPGRSQAQKLQRRQRMKLWHTTLECIVTYIQPPQVCQILQPVHSAWKRVVAYIQTSQVGVVSHCRWDGCVKAISVQSEKSQLRQRRDIDRLQLVVVKT